MVQRQYGKKGKGSRINRLYHSETSAEYIANFPDEIGLGNYCVASCGDWYVVVKFASKSNSFLWNPIANLNIQLPRMPKKDFKSFSKCILTAPPTQKHSAILFFSKKIPSISYCKVGDTRWTHWRYFTRMTNPKHIFREAISCNGKIYALNFDGLQEILLVGHKRRLKLYVTMVSVAYCTAEKDYLIDSGGELFMVRRFSISRLEVFKMDFSCQEWEKVNYLGNDRVFFLSSQYSVSLCAEELGIKGNCIYSIEEDNKSLYFFDYGSKSLSVSQHKPNSGPVWFSSRGLLPFLRLNEKPTCEQLGEGEEEDEEVENDTNMVSREVREDDGEGKSILLELPLELQESIAKRVSVGQDYMNFRAVCRTWRSIAPPCRWCCNASTTIPHPWLVLFQLEKDRFDFRDPRDNGTYHVTITAELSPDCVIQFAKDDYLLVSQGERSIFLFELFTNKRIQLPDMPEDSYLSGICVSTSPFHSENWVIFGFGSLEPGSIDIYYLSSGMKMWAEKHIYGMGIPFLASWISPVYLDGSFYCLGQDGSLLVFELKQPGRFSFRIWSKDQQLILPSTLCRSFLVSVDEEGLLLSVFVGNSGEWVRVYKLDSNLEGNWEKWSSLGHLMLFVSETSSLAVEAKEETMSNKIYFPFFTKTKANNLFYSLESGEFQSFDQNDHLSCGDDLKLCDTTQPLHCAWVQPRLVPTFS